MTADRGPDAVEAHAAELAGLFPALADALSRDNAPSDGRGGQSSGAVVNTDVLNAMVTLHAEVPAACATAADLTGERWQRRPVSTCLTAIPRFHGRLMAMHRLADAGHLERALAGWRRTVKLALGLCTPDTPIGYCCPLHEEPSPLVMLGSEGFITGHAAVSWQHDGRIWCRLCGESWPVWQWRRLGLMLESA